MSPREAIRILILSPFYFTMKPAERWQLVREFCRSIRKSEGTSNERVSYAQL